MDTTKLKTIVTFKVHKCTPCFLVNNLCRKIIIEIHHVNRCNSHNCSDHNFTVLDFRCKSSFRSKFHFCVIRYRLYVSLLIYRLSCFLGGIYLCCTHKHELPYIVLNCVLIDKLVTLTAYFHFRFRECISKVIVSRTSKVYYTFYILFIKDFFVLVAFRRLCLIKEISFFPGIIFTRLFIYRNNRVSLFQKTRTNFFSYNSTSSRNHNYSHFKKSPFSFIIDLYLLYQFHTEKSMYLCKMHIFFLKADLNFLYVGAIFC